MRRRAFIAGLGGAAPWPLVARAQGERVRRICVLMTVDDADSRASYAAFVEALQRLGWTEGRNVQIETRWAGSRTSDFQRHATDLVSLAPEVIFAFGTVSLAPLLQATHTVPIVFASVPIRSAPASSKAWRIPAETPCSVRIHLEREMAGTSQRDRAERDPNSGPSGSFASQLDRPIRGHTVRGADARGRRDSDQLARCRRYRTRRHGICRLPKWRAHLDYERIGSDPSRTDHRARGQAPTARGLLPALLRRQRRIDLVWF